MTVSLRIGIALILGGALIGSSIRAQSPPAAAAGGNAMNNPFRMLEKWPHLGTIKPGAAIGIVPDNKGGVWLQHRPDPAMLHIDASGNIVKHLDRL